MGQILYRIKAEADRLDNEQKGYIAPWFKTRKSIAKFMVKKSKYRIAPERFYDSKESIFVYLYVNSNGEISSIQGLRVHGGRIRRSLPGDDPHFMEGKRIIGMLGKTEPARFKGQPVDGGLVMGFSFIE